MDTFAEVVLARAGDEAVGVVSDYERGPPDLTHDRVNGR